MDRQKMFNKSYRGLQKQKFQASVDMDGCSYRGLDGFRCAIGHNIPDKFYRKEMDVGSKSLTDIIPDLLKSCPELVNYWDVKSDDDLKWIRDLQKCHDYAMSAEDMKNRLYKFAKRHKLSIP